MPSFVRAGAAFTANSLKTASQSHSSIATLSDGGYVVVWQTANPADDGAGAAIKLQRYNSQGTLVGTETLINTAAAGDQLGPKVAALASGGYVVTWETSDSTQDGNGTAIKAQLFNAAGSRIGSEFRVNSQTFMDQHEPNVTGLADGGFVIAWYTNDTAQDGAGWAIKAQRYNASGAPVGGEFLVNSVAFGSQYNIDIAKLASGGFVITWQTGNSSGTQVSAQIYGADGAKAGSEIVVSNGFSSHTAGRVAGLPDGGFVVAWMTDNSGGIGIRAQIFGAAGNKVGSDFIVNPGTLGINPDVAVLADGSFVISWEGRFGGIEAQAYSASGQRLGNEYTVADAPDATETGVAIAALVNGTFVVGWTNTVTGSATGDDIRLQLLAPNAAPELGAPTRAVSVAENNVLATFATAVDSDGPAPVSYAIVGGADAARFTINASTGTLSFVAAPNYEQPADSDKDNVYQVSVRASDGELQDVQAISVTVTNVNEGLSITSNGGRATAAVSVPENGAAVTTVTANDADGDAPAYSISGGADAALFIIDPATGALRFRNAPDFEHPADAGANNVYDVVVRATDGQFAATQSLAITVTNVAEAPQIVSDGGGDAAALAIAEGTSVVTTVAAVAEAGATLTYSIAGGADARLFAINSATGTLSFVTAPDFEAPRDAGWDNVYDVVVRATDGQFADDQHLSVTVTNVNEGIFILSPSSVFVPENGIAAATVIAFDPDGTPITYSIAGGADASAFVINAATGALSFVSAPDYEARADVNGDNVYDVIVRASDGQLFDDRALPVKVSNVNEPLSISAASTVSVAENGTFVTTVGATDLDRDAAVYSISGGADAALFAIDSATGALSFASARDFEAPVDAGHDNVYDVVVRASDGEFFDEQHVAVTVTNLNEGIAITSPASLSVLEGGTAAGIVTAVDPDGTPASYSIAGGADAALFTIDAATGALSFVAAPDFEAPRDANGDNVYDVVVRASDGELFDDRAITVTVGNVNEPLSITSGASVSVAENSSFVKTVTATDRDGDAPVYSIGGGADAALFVIDAATGALRFASAPNFEAPADAGHDNVYDVVVWASDGEFSDQQHVAVTVTNLNEGIGITSATSLSVLEGATLAGTAIAFDPDGTAVAYSIMGGADAALFTIDAGTGALSFVAAPDFEAPRDANGDNVYNVVVRASDGELFDDRALTVTVGNVNEPLSITSGASVSLAENSSFVTTVAATDRDGDAPVYSIGGGADAALFVIDAATGALRFAFPPNFEAPADAGHDNVYDVVVRASDGQFWDDQHVAVTVTNVNEGIAITSGAAFSVLENGTAAGAVTAFDPDGTPPAFSIAGGADAAWFTIDAATGALSFRSAPDFEAPRDADGDNVYQVLVRASDGELGAQQLVSVRVGNVDEGVTIAAPAAVSVRENDVAVTNVAGTDADGGRVTYAISGGADAALFTIDAATGALRFVSAPDFERPADAGRDNVYNVVVSTSDGSFTASQAIAVTVANVEEAVAFGAASKSFSVAENGAAVGNVLAVDPDGGRVAYAIAGGADAALFTIDAVTGALSFRAAPDYEAPRDANGDNVYAVIVSASDGATSATQAVSVSVANVDEAVRLASYGGASSVALSVAENGRAVGTVAAADPDGDRVSYAIGGGADAAWFTVDAATGALSFVSAPDFEAKADAGHDNVYDVTVVASSATSSIAQAFAVSVSNVDEPVAITSFGGGNAGALSITENTRVVGTVTAVDPDGAAVTYSIAGGADAARFTIDAKTGVLQFVTAPDYEAPNDAGADHVYDVTVKASDGTTSDVQAISITVLNVQDGVTIMGSSGSDAINGTTSNPALRTTAAEDTVFGGDGNDTIQGLGGDDNLNGDGGKDVLIGGAGADRLIGGAGADQFVYTAVSDSTPTVRDLITDFSHAQGDKIVLTGIDANSLVAGDQAFTFIGSGAFSHHAGELRFEADGHGNTIVSGDVNGDGIADFQVQLVGTIALVSSDFLL